MDLARVAVLLNPAAGSGRALPAAYSVAGALRRAGVEVDLLAGKDAEEAGHLAAQAVSGGADAVIACGGDGLVHLAIQQLAETDVILGVVPCGTGNDFARSIGIPRSTQPAIDVILAGHSVVSDLGRAGDRWFGAVLASGFDSRVNDRGNRMRWPRGRMRYNLAMLAELAAFRPIGYRLTVDEQQFDISAMLVAVGNGPSYGGGMKICPAASICDGLLEVTVVSRMSRAKLVRLFPSVYSGTHVRYPEVQTFRGARISLAAIDVTAYADGELIGSLPLVCTAAPGALRVFAPR